MSKATQSEPFATTAGKVKTRLRQTGHQVSIVASPDVKNGAYRAEPGLYLVVGTPAPQPTPGGGRYNTQSKRVLQVWVVSMNLTDPAGADEAALAAHWAMEDAVLDALIDGKSQSEKIGVGSGVHWLPGGDEVRRQVKTDLGILLSIMLFGVEYQAPTTTS